MEFFLYFDGGGIMKAFKRFKSRLNAELVSEQFEREGYKTKIIRVPAHMADRYAEAKRKKGLME